MIFITVNNTGGTIYVQGGFVARMKNANGYIATNTGDTIVTVDGHILYPGVPGTNNGDTIVVGGNLGEIYTKSISVNFGAGANPSVTIDQKFYSIDKPIKLWEQP